MNLKLEPINIPDDFDIKKYKYFVKEYKKSFKNFDSFLDSFFYSFFGCNTNFIYLRSDEKQKNFLISLLNDLNLAFITTFEKMFKYTYLLNKEDLKDKLLLVFKDDFDFKDDQIKLLKSLNNTLYLNKRYKKIEKIHLYNVLLINTDKQNNEDKNLLKRFICFNVNNVKGNINLDELYKYLKVYTNRYLTKKINKIF